MSKRAKRGQVKRKQEVALMQSGKRRWVVLFALTMMAIGYSGLQVVDAATETRVLYQQLGEIQRQEDELLEENSRLSLERGSIANLQNVEEVAHQQLGMEFPSQVLPGLEEVTPP